MLRRPLAEGVIQVKPRRGRAEARASRHAPSPGGANLFRGVPSYTLPPSAYFWTTGHCTGRLHCIAARPRACCNLMYTGETWPIVRRWWAWRQNRSELHMQRAQCGSYIWDGCCRAADEVPRTRASAVASDGADHGLRGGAPVLRPPPGGAAVGLRAALLQPHDAAVLHGRGAGPAGRAAGRRRGARHLCLDHGAVRQERPCRRVSRWIVPRGVVRPERNHARSSPR